MGIDALYHRLLLGGEIGGSNVHIHMSNVAQNNHTNYIHTYNLT